MALIDTNANRKATIAGRTAEHTERLWRNKELKATDYIVALMDFTPHQDWLDYRQQLRDFPDSDTFPGTRPVKPDQATPTGY